jgi:plastocyanin
MTVSKSAMLAAVLGAMSGIALACGALAQAAAVKIANFKFGPETVTTAVNTPVTWTNDDSAPHQIVAGNQKTAVLQKGQSAQLSFASAGSFDYVCGIHPTMKGKIVVQ